ncbi:hypothetical protein HKT18_07920 [Flavobacterium sp. IMCC34852]|uniref:TonB-dependent receptor plug domain-containing protein n=1 Tax=Flavobacterium rivulicola TaxID=2732161 RepID=A0A7Y3VZ60_9FLAO|nr:hypothetical protein [Flavobacterium sp. IMCC34852]NNT72136.1 hypothetical protein [Flavobacterium sp. IMCC34852]
MKRIFLALLTCFLLSCSSQKKITENSIKTHTFLLQDKDKSKFELVEAIKEAYSEGSFINSPIVAIDGIVFKYDKSQDTIVLPLKKMDITNIVYLNKQSSPAIYGKRETNGAIIINTINLK